VTKNLTTPRTCTPEILEMLCRVLDQSCHSLLGRTSNRDSSNDEIKVSLAQAILAAYEEGETDEVRLRRQALLRLNWRL
jgi:hypothetical protein